ncbi:MAG: ATP-binding protein [Arcicella sp.]|nr:ATP-binding protein [Arcicella sp.]
MEKSTSIIGRQNEIAKLQKITESPKSEFIALYGRRRVGKTFLIREFFNYTFDFQISGLANADTSQQLFNFHSSLLRQSRLLFEQKPINWLEAFQQLIDHLENVESDAKKVIFFDEMPWLDTKASDFLIGLEHFWNSWATNRKDIILITCGSAASWMINVLINNSGGLHNRITQRMKIEPFCLEEVEAFLEAKNCILDRYQIIQLYMTVGGIPYYLDAINPEFSATQNIQALFFDRNSFLRNEFFNLYRSLFRKHEIYEQVVETLSTKTQGLQRSDIVALSNISSGGTLTRVLIDLEESGFITSYTSLNQKSNHILYRLSDFYTAFYFRFIKENIYVGNNAWINLLDNPIHRTWQGFTFEQICINHVEQIKKTLGIHGILSRETTWKGKYEDKSAQIDLLIDRRDQVINLCEAKFSLDKYVITKEYSEKLRSKISIFKEATKTKKSVFLTMITTYGVEKNKNSTSIIQNEITMNDLFS